jgi:hypothetical protein
MLPYGPGWYAESEPPADLARRVANRETATEAERGHYTYRQTVSISDYSGEYRETRDIIFSPSGERTEVAVGKPSNNLRRLLLTEEDFRDMREIQPMLLTRDTLWLYDTKFRGEDSENGIDCWLLEIRPRQILEGQRLFDGTLWIDKRDFSILRSDGKAVPEILRMKQDNLFPRFTTLRERIGEYWFPSKTLADDTLQFRSGPVRMRMRIEYSNYKRFGAESSIEYK